MSLDKTKVEDEAVLDRGASFVKHVCDEEEVEGHHTVYVGVHIPKSFHRRRRHRRKSSHKERRERPAERSADDKSDGEVVDEAAISILKPLITPAERIRFILGEEDDGPLPPQLFTELDELLAVDGQEMEWKETARWIKFEEKVEEGGERWSKPHVATLSLHSLMELKTCIETGTILLDLEASTLPQIVGESQLGEKIMYTLLRKHRHQTKKSNLRSLADIGKTVSSPYLALYSDKMWERKQPLFKYIPPFNLTIKIDFSSFKLPRDAEASNVLVGEVDFLETPFVAFVRLQQAVMLGTLTEVPVPTRFLFVLLGPKGKAKSYHEIGRAIATLMSDEVFHDIAYKAKDRQDLLAGIEEFLDEVIVLPPGEWDPDIRIEPPKSVPSVGEELQCTRRFCGGLILDVKRKLPFFASDFYDALHIQTLSTILFIYLGTVTNAITFGGLLGDATDNIFLGTALTGAVFCLLAGQPLTILSSTGPVLVFERLLFNFSTTNGFDYLEFRLWIGLWSGVFCLVLVATDASFLVQYFTRFTEEGFSALISFIFIYDAFKKMLKLAHHHPINKGNLVPQYDCRCIPPLPGRPTLPGNAAHSPPRTSWASLDKEPCLRLGGSMKGSACTFVPDITLMSFILFFGTYTCSMCLKKFKTSRFFPTTVRKLISDFAIILTIFLFCGVDALVGVNTPKLLVPSEFKPTHPGRVWFIPPFGGNPWWVCLAAALPALLVTILIFMDQQITAVIVNRKEHKLKKGAGYHLDLFWVAVLIIVCSFTGLPWYVAATVISIAHIDSLKMETKTSAPGEMPKFLGVREQRVTGVIVFILTGLSVFMAPILKFIPMPVLYGVFLYMGVASLNGVQFMDRLQLLLMPAKHQPDLIYLRHVPQRRIHLFTFIQALCLALLWILKSTVAAIVFPIMILALVAVRKAMDYLFSQHDLSYLDDVIPEKDKKKKEDEKKKKSSKKKGSIDSEIDFVS
uniref:Anion exchange protein n=1 Tax=Gadus morhua TaxID=8049 RepID=A0A8C5BMS0_GADMO